MEFGTVKVWMEDRGFGFITDANGLDVFVHARQLLARRRDGSPALTQGDRVSFRRLEDDSGRGPKAYDVSVCDDSVVTVDQFCDELNEIDFGSPGYRTALVEMARAHGWVV